MFVQSTCMLVWRTGVFVRATRALFCQTRVCILTPCAIVSNLHRSSWSSPAGSPTVVAQRKLPATAPRTRGKGRYSAENERFTERNVRIAKRTISTELITRIPNM